MIRASFANGILHRELVIWFTFKTFLSEYRKNVHISCSKIVSAPRPQPCDDITYVNTSYYNTSEENDADLLIKLLLILHHSFASQSRTARANTTTKQKTKILITTRDVCVCVSLRVFECDFYAIYFLLLLRYEYTVGAIFNSNRIWKRTETATTAAAKSDKNYYYTHYNATYVVCCMLA